MPSGATILEPVGTAPGLVVPVDGGPTVVVLPGPPRELHEMWPAAVRTEAFRAAVAGAVELRQEMLRLFGIPESEIAETLRLAEDAHGLRGAGDHDVPAPRRGRGRHALLARGGRVYERFVETVRERHADTLFSDDGRTVDQQVADLLRARGLTIATAESCTGGLLAGAADRPGRLVGLRAGRARRLLQRGEGGAGGRRSRAHRARGSGLGRGRRGAGRRGAGGAGRGRRRGHHGRGGARGRDAREARRARVLQRGGSGRRSPDAVDEPARATGPTSATARPPSPCTWCGGCWSGRDSASLLDHGDGGLHS